MEHFNSHNDNPNYCIKVTFEDVTEKSGMVVESQMKVFQKTHIDCGRPQYTLNLYHTNNRMMVNGRHAMQFNSGHNHIADLIISSEQVSVMDRNMLFQIEEGLKEIIVSKTVKRSDTCSIAKQQRAREVRPSPSSQALQTRRNEERACFPKIVESIREGPQVLCCPSCDQDIESKHSICCDQCEVWFHAECE